MTQSIHKLFTQEKNKILDEQSAKIDENTSGTELVKRYCDLGRQLGKTTQLLKAIPEEGNVIILSTNKKYTEELIFNKFGVQNRIKVFSVKKLSDAFYSIRGFSGKILIDNSVIDTEIMRIIQEFYNHPSILPTQISNEKENRKTS